MTATQINSPIPIPGSATAKSGFTITAYSAYNVCGAKFFMVNVRTNSALTAGSYYTVADLPLSGSFGAAFFSTGLGNCTASAEISVRPTVNVAANATLFIRGFIL